ncbi:MAG TPA: dihydrodipicolinate synthase family protein [Candidatus Hydrogenedentes bacterium]|nr:dihydrodipicolinate synthase family protein [Candidatus Hydrogenedentota bacterium]
MKVPDYIRGSIAPTFTVFKDDGALDDAGQRRFMDFLFERGAISAFFVRSGMGQMYAFDKEDVKRIARNVCPHMKGKAPVLIGCSGIWDRNYDKRPDPDVYLSDAIELSRYAADLGADGVVHTMPEALLPRDGESVDDLIMRYFTAVCEAVPEAPVLIYQAPNTREEYCVTQERIARLADLDNLVGMKVSSVNGHYIFDLIRAVRGKTFGFIVGAETVFYAGLVAGARACIGQGAALNPQIIQAVLDRFLEGDIEGAAQAQEDVNELVNICPNAVDFMKRYATEHGCAVGLHARSAGGNPYMKDRVLMSDADYLAYKARYDELLERYL